MSENRSELVNAVINFESVLPVYFFTILKTCDSIAFGELHRVYYDVVNIDEEDPELIKLLQPFITSNIINIAHYDPHVIALRKYLTNSGYKTKVQDNTLDHFALVKYASDRLSKLVSSLSGKSNKSKKKQQKV